MTAVAAAETAAARLEPVRFTLDNGMTFLVVERPGRPLVSAVWAVRGGSAADPPGQRGVAHVVEHLLYAGSRTIGTRDMDAESRLLRQWERLYEDTARRRRAASELASLERRLAALGRPGEYAAIYTRAGALGLDAETRHDLTAFQVLVPAEKIELWFWMESDRLLEPVFRGFERELRVVEQERRQRIDASPAGVWFERFDAVYWGEGHPYAHSPGGDRQEVADLLPADARAHFEAAYRPDRLVAVLVGDLSPARARRLAERYFGRLRRPAARAASSAGGVGRGRSSGLGPRERRARGQSASEHGDLRRQAGAGDSVHPGGSGGSSDSVGPVDTGGSGDSGGSDGRATGDRRDSSRSGGSGGGGEVERGSRPLAEAALGSLQGTCVCRRQVEIRYPTVPFQASGDGVALDVLAGVLNGRSGRLHRRLVLAENAVATSASAEHVSRMRGGYFAVRIEAADGAELAELIEAWDGLLEQFREDTREDVREDTSPGAEQASGAELERVRRQLATDSYRQLETDLGLARRLAAAEVLGGAGQVEEWFENAAAVSATDLLRVVDAFLVADRRAVLSLERAGEG